MTACHHIPMPVEGRRRRWSFCPTIVWVGAIPCYSCDGPFLDICLFTYIPVEASPHKKRQGFQLGRAKKAAKSTEQGKQEVERHRNRFKGGRQPFSGVKEAARWQLCLTGPRHMARCTGDPPAFQEDRFGQHGRSENLKRLPVRKKR